MAHYKYSSLFAFLFWLPSFGAVDAEKILKEAEFIRNPPIDYETKVTLMDVKDGAKDVHTYQVLLKGATKALVRFLTPLVDKGTKILMVENDMWVYLPSTSKPVRISPRQKLTGNAAYGDITRLSFLGNYQAKLLREEDVEGKKAYVLGLTSIEGRPVTYDRVEYWVEKDTHRPLKAHFMTPSGKVLREGYYGKYKDVFGVSRPIRLTLVDHLKPNHRTLLHFGKPVKAAHPAILFEKENFAQD